MTELRSRRFQERIRAKKIWRCTSAAPEGNPGRETAVEEEV